MLELEESRKEAYRLFLTAHSRLNATIDREMTKAGLLPLNWYDVLVSLEYAEDHSLRMSDLANAVLLSRSGLTRLVDKLEQRGYVTRKVCPRDKRGSLAVLTAEGQQARASSWPLFSSLVAELFGNQMTDNEATTVSSVMMRSVSAVRQFDEDVSGVSLSSRRI